MSRPRRSMSSSRAICQLSLIPCPLNVDRRETSIVLAASTDEIWGRFQSQMEPRRKGVPMSTNTVRRANLAAIACEPRPQLPDGFKRNSTRVGADLGAARTGLSVYELPPGQAIGPYHYENPDEEWLLVVSGTPTLRHPGGEDELEPLDIVFFPSGPAGAHLVRNTSESTARVAMFSSQVAT